MRIPLFVQRVDSAGINNDLDAGLAWVLAIVLNGTLDATEAAANVSDHHVANNELRARVRWIDFVGCFQSEFPFFDGLCQNLS
jgi:hypothetical protein